MFIKKLTGTAVFAALATVSVFTFAELEGSRGNCHEEPDFLLILGCRVRGDEPELTLRTRIDAAAKYLSEHKNVIAICCGGIVHDDQTKSEAQAILEGLVGQGIDEARIILEDESKTTAENFANAKKIIDSMNLDAEPKIAFLSSEYHLLRAGFIGKLAGVNAKSVPAPSPEHLRLKNYFREFTVFPDVLRDMAKSRKNGGDT